MDLGRLLELDVAAQLDHAGTIRRAAGSEAAVLDVSAAVGRRSSERTGGAAEDWVVPGVGRFSLEFEPDLLKDCNGLGERKVVVERVGAIQIDDAANGFRRRVGSDVVGVRAAFAVRSLQVLEIDEQ